MSNALLELGVVRTGGDEIDRELRNVVEYADQALDAQAVEDGIQRQSHHKLQIGMQYGQAGFGCRPDLNGERKEKWSAGGRDGQLTRSEN